MAGFMGGQFSIDHDGTCTGIVVRGDEDQIITKNLPLESPEQLRGTILIASRRSVAPYGHGAMPRCGFDRS
jgi:hypothetical protein